MAGAKSIFDSIPKGQLVAAIKRNHETLRECSYHDFPLKKRNVHLLDRIQCKRCDGEMSVQHARIWTDGFKAGLKKGKEANQ